MKEITMDISEITYSREMYEAKPKPFVSAFIYIFLVIVIASIVFMSIGTIDIVTKANGIVRPNQQVSTVKNLLTEEVAEVNYENGQWVNEGDVLLVLNHEAQDISKKLYSEQLDKKQKELALLQTYKASIKQKTNLFDPTIDEAYYNQYEKFQLNMSINQHELAYSDELTGAKLASAKEQQATLETYNHYIGLLEGSIIGGETMLADTTGSIAGYYKIQYDEYIMSCNAIKRQYDDKALEIKLGENTQLASMNLDEALLDQCGYQVIKQSLDENRNVFDDVESTQDKYTRAQLMAHESSYNNYLAKVNEYTGAYNTAKADYDLKLSQLGNGSTAEEVESAKQAMDKALNDLDTYKINYYIQITNYLTDLEAKILELKSTNKVEQSKDTVLSNNQQSMDMALDQLKNSTLVALREQKTANEASINQLKQTRKQLEVESNKSLVDEETGEYLMINHYEVNELVTVLNNIDVLEDEIEQLETQLEQVEKERNQAIIKASQSGKVNIATDVMEGDVVVAGTHLLTIVPEDDTAYKVQIVLNNKDVAKVSEDDKIKYHFEALPYKEYGELTGNITKISSDAQFDEGTGQSFYNVEATLNEQMIYNYKGELSKVKVGMICEAQVITGQKSILRFLLEKIDILD